MEAELHDGTILEFPDGTDPAVVQATVQRVLASRSAAPQEPSGAGAAPQAGGGTPPAAPSALEPSTLLRNTLGTMVDMLRVTPPNMAANKKEREQVQAGVANSGIRAGLGVKSLFKKLDKEDQIVLDEAADEQKKAGTLGQMGQSGGDFGRTMVENIVTPGGKVLKKVLGKAEPYIAPYVKAAVASGGDTFLTTPTNDMGERVKDAEISAALGPLLIGGAKAVGKAGTGLFSATQDAINLFKQNVNPTLAQASSTRWGQFVGGLTSGFTNTRRRLEGEILDALTERASGGGVSAPQGTVAERLEQLRAANDADRGNLMTGKRFPITDQTRQAALAAGDVTKSGDRFASETAKASKTLENIIGTDTRTTRVGDRTFQADYIDPLDAAIGSSTNARVVAALTKAKNILETHARGTSLTAAESAQLEAINSRLFDIQRLEAAASGGAAQQEGINIKKLADSYAAKAPPGNTTNEDLIGPVSRSIGQTPRQQEARSAMVNVGRAASFALGTHAVTGTGAIVAPLYALSAIGQTGKGSKFLTGNMNWQTGARDALNSPQTRDITLQNLLRAFRDNAYGVGSLVTPPPENQYGP